MHKEMRCNHIPGSEQGAGAMQKEKKKCDGEETPQTVDRKHGISGNAGFSIIEVMIGIAIFSIGVLAIFGMQISGVRGNATARHLTEAATVGMDKMEALMTLPYNHVDLNDRTADGVAGLFNATVGTADRQENDPEGRYEIFWNVADEDIIEHSKTVSVIVVWNRDGMKRSVSMQRIIPQII